MFNIDAMFDWTLQIPSVRRTWNLIFDVGEMSLSHLHSLLPHLNSIRTLDSQYLSQIEKVRFIVPLNKKFISN